MLDPERIQHAMDGCEAGKAVDLASHHGSIAGMAGNANLSEPLEMPNADAKPGDAIKCGTLMPRAATLPTFSMNQAARPRASCGPLININVKNAAIMGEGTIDGRGYGRLKGHDLIDKDVCMRGVPIPISPYYTNQTAEPFEDPSEGGDVESRAHHRHHSSADAPSV